MVSGGPMEFTKSWQKIKMRFFNGILLSVFIFTVACKQKDMNFKLIEKQDLAGIPSASGIEITQNGLYAVGDDSPWLFRLTDKFEIEEKIPLLPERPLPDSIFEKLVKPDFEAMCKINEGGTKLYVFGSGSKSPERDVLVEVDLSKEITTKEYSLLNFYKALKTQAKISDTELNIEGAEVVEDHLYLFNRGRNIIFRYSLSGFQKYLSGITEVPLPEVYNYELPEINGIEAGFSGASYSTGAKALIFTATVEDTSNWIDDGEVLGSFLGVIFLDDMENRKPLWVAIKDKGEILKIKVESVTILPPYQKEKADLLMVTDSDGDVSEILTGTLTF